MRWQKIAVWDLYACVNYNESFLCINPHQYPDGTQRRWTTQHLCSTTRFNIGQSTPTSPTYQTHSGPVSMIPRCEINLTHGKIMNFTGWTASEDSRAGVWFHKATLRVPRSLRQYHRKTSCAEVFVMDQMIHHHHHDIKIFSAGWITGLTSRLSFGPTLPMSQRWKLFIMQLDVLKHFVLSPSVSTACRWPAFFGWVWIQFKIWWAHCKEFK